MALLHLNVRHSNPAAPEHEERVWAVILSCSLETLSRNDYAAHWPIRSIIIANYSNTTNCEKAQASERMPKLSRPLKVNDLRRCCDHQCFIQ